MRVFNVATLVIIFLVIPISGCTHILATKFVKAPNHSKSAEEIGEISEVALKKLGVDQRFRIEVGPPSASLSVWIIEPKTEPATFEIYTKQGWQVCSKFIPDDVSKRTTDTVKGTILLLHGIYDNKSMWVYMVWGHILSAGGYRTVLIDMRGHGESTGNWITYGVVESHDISQVIDFLEEKGMVSGQIGIFGGSYGAAVAIQTAAVDKRIRAVVALEPYCSIEEASYTFVRQYLDGWSWLISEKTVRKAIKQGGNLADFDISQTPLKAIAQTNAPILLIHGEADKHVPSWHSKQLYARAKGYCELLLIDNETHLTLGREFVLLRDDILQWFDDRLEP